MDNKTYKRGLRRELPLYDDMSDIAFLRTGDVVPTEITEEIIDKFNDIGCTSFTISLEQIDDVLNKLKGERK